MENPVIIKLNQIVMPIWVKWFAQDADGHWWGYEAEPHQHDHGWYENEIGRCIKLLQTKPEKNWQYNLSPRKK